MIRSSFDCVVHHFLVFIHKIRMDSFEFLKSFCASFISISMDSIKDTLSLFFLVLRIKRVNRVIIVRTRFRLFSLQPQRFQSFSVRQPARQFVQQFGWHLCKILFHDCCEIRCVLIQIHIYSSHQLIQRLGFHLFVLMHEQYRSQFLQNSQLIC